MFPERVTHVPAKWVQYAVAMRSRDTNVQFSNTRGAGHNPELHVDGALVEVAACLTHGLDPTQWVRDLGHPSSDPDLVVDDVPIDVKKCGFSGALVGKHNCHGDWLYAGGTIVARTHNGVWVWWSRGGRWGRNLTEEPQELPRPRTRALNWIITPPWDVVFDHVVKSRVH